MYLSEAIMYHLRLFFVRKSNGLWDGVKTESGMIAFGLR